MKSAWFIRGSASLIFAGSIFLFLMAGSHFGILDLRDPLWFLPDRILFYLAGAGWLIGSALCVTAANERRALKWIAALALGVALFRAGEWLIGSASVWNCFGCLHPFLPLRPRTIDLITSLALGWLGAGSGFFLVFGKPDVPGNEPVRRRHRLRENIFAVLKVWAAGGLFIVVLVQLIHLRLQSVLPKHRETILNEAYFHGEILTAPAVNHSGDKLMYVRTTKAGVGVFLVELNSLKRRQIAEGNAARASRSEAVTLFGWSPDDRYAAFSTIAGGGESRQVNIVEGDGGVIVTSFDAAHSLLKGIWLTTNSLAFIDRSQFLWIYNLERDVTFGPFGTKGLVALRQLDPSAGALVAVSGRRLAYLEKGNVWTLEIGSNQPVPQTQFQDTALEGLDYAAGTKKFLFGYKSATSRLKCLGDRTLDSAPDAEFNRLTDTNSNYALKGQWILGGNGLAYMGVDDERYFIAIRTAMPGLETNLFTVPARKGSRPSQFARTVFPEGMEVVRNYSVCPPGDKLYAVASLSWEPLAIWEYDLRRQTVRNVVPASETAGSLQRIFPSENVVTNEAGREVYYYYFAPPETADRPVPVVIDVYPDPGFQPNSQFLANSGIYFVSISRYGYGRGERPADTADIVTVYRELLKNPRVDPRRIYLLGESEGTTRIAQLINDHPEFWRGAILLSPLEFPIVDGAQSRFPSLFVSMGDEDQAALRRNAELFVQNACAHSVWAELHYGHAGHVFYSIDEVKKRYAAIVRFICSER